MKIKTKPEPRPFVIRLRVSAQERDAIRKAAKAAKLTLSAYLRTEREG